MRRHGTNSAYIGGCRCLPCTLAGIANRRRGLPDGDPRHGTKNGYQNLGCRCADCREANRLHHQADRAAMRARAADIPHGTPSGYQNWGCRCMDCTAAHASSRREWKSAQ